MIKRDEIAFHDSCLNKAADDEPIFVLRAHDALAPAVVRAWATLAAGAGAPFEKFKSACDLAELMEKWPNRKLPD
jgi:hypothetical protein